MTPRIPAAIAWRVDPYRTSLALRDVALSRGDRPLVTGLSVKVGPGELLWLTGPNGSGKTTLLLACAGLLRPDRGDIAWSPGSARASIAYAAHRGPERDGLSLGEELAFWRRVHADAAPLADRLASADLSAPLDTPVSGLSVGQRRRLALARLLMADKPAWLLDEPLSGLDDAGRALTTRAIQDHLARGGLALVASHRPMVIPGVQARKLVLEAP